ncbi:hypothetical protein N431DRAFT_492498 [Stipitochalara longipes BDJ]|nr:hypothetical protein N431DRAFT_492498 [Stipitochalara longipes BDJ]
MWARCIQLLMFVGAPEASSLDWQESGLLNSFSASIARFAGVDDRSTTPHRTPITPALTSASTTHPSWRSLPLERQHLTTGLTQSFDRHHLFTGLSQSKDSQGTSFFVASQINSFMEELSQAPSESHASSHASAEELLSQFYEESYARHEDIKSSQIAPASDVATSYTSDELSSDSFESPLRSFGATKEVPVSGHLSNLRDLPNAVYLNSIHPQTMTVNLIVGIISIPESRAIKTRRGAAVELIEVLVGDETRSGLGVNFWLSSSQSAQEDMRGILSGLRPRDVVLLRNVALSNFRGKVYGQSLRRDMTKVHLLYRTRVDKSDVRGCYSASDLALGGPAPPQVEKTRRVREWVLKFAGMGAGQQKGKGPAQALKEVLPPDTQ